MRPRELLLERIASGELPEPPDLAPAERARLQELRALNAALLVRRPAAEAAADIRARARPPARRLVLLAPIGVAVALLALFVARSRDDVVEKGGRPQLLVYRQEAGGPKLLEDGAEVRAGDVVQLAYVADGARHGVILSVDGSGAVSLHHPAKAGDLSELVPGGETRLPYAFRLDDTAGDERFYLVSSDDELDVHAVLLAAESGARRPANERLALPSTLRQTAVRLRKALAPRPAVPGRVEGHDGGAP